MKKILATIFAVLMMSALTVSVFAEDQEAATQQKTTTQQEAATQQETAEQQEAAAQIAAKLTEADALTAALEDAGKKEADVTVTKNRLSEKQTTTGSTIAVYTVKFNTADTTYKYILDANTGMVYYRDVTFQSADAVFKGRGHGKKESGGTGIRPGKGSRGQKKGTTGGSTTEGGSTEGSTDGEGTDKEAVDGQSSGVS